MIRFLKSVILKPWFLMCMYGGDGDDNDDGDNDYDEMLNMTFGFWRSTYDFWTSGYLGGHYSSHRFADCKQLSIRIGVAMCKACSLIKRTGHGN